jgi:hypothetical protein
VNLSFNSNNSLSSDEHRDLRVMVPVKSLPLNSGRRVETFTPSSEIDNEEIQNDLSNNKSLTMI